MSTVLSILLLAGLPDISDKDFVSPDKQTFLSLRPGESNKAGTVWIERRSKVGSVVGHGCYSLFESNGEPRLRLNVPRLWIRDAKKDDGFPWRFDDMYYNNSTDAHSVECEVAKSKDDLIITVVDFGKCSRDAVWAGRIQTLSNEFFESGEIVRIRPAVNYDPLAENELPSYVTRSVWKNRVKTHPKTVFELEALDVDWYGWGQGPCDPFYILSFRPSGTDVFNGEAWLISIWKEPRTRITSVHACKGKYEFARAPTPEFETLALQYSTRRIYTGEGRGDTPLKWSLMVQEDLERFPGFMEFSVPLTDRGFNSTRQPLILDNASYINAAGNKTVKTYSDGFLKLNTKVDDPQTVLEIGEGYAVVFATGMLGVTNPLRLDTEQKYMAMLDESLPPGLELRPYKVSQTAARMANAAAANAKVNYKERLEKAEKAYREMPKDPVTAQNLAWLLATTPDASLRDGKRALDLAAWALREAGTKEPDYLDTLAAAGAEAGQFKFAIMWQTDAIKYAPEADRKAFKERLDLYRKSLPYREK